jgi:general secretion pathway protein G
MKQKGFTLIELLVVTAIVGVLASVILISLNEAREKGRVAVAVANMRQVATAIQLYYSDTGKYPSDCDRSCTSNTDPFLKPLGVTGWNGPYMSLWDKRHPWNGHLSYFYTSQTGPVIFLDDDAPTSGGNDNTGLVPTSSMQRIDAILDDGNLLSGKVQQASTAGEVTYQLYWH